MAEGSARTPSPDIAQRQTSPFSTAAHLLLLLGVIAGVSLAGVWEDGSIAAFLAATGLALLVCPPRIRVDGKIWIAAGALLFTASLALLPQNWFGTPEWRQQLIAAGVPLPASISATPRETLFWLAILALALGTILFALAHPLRSRTQLALSLIVVLVCALYAGLAIYARKAGAEFAFAPDPNEFGFFRNRNHTSTFLVTGSVIALGILAVAFRNRHWVAGSVAAACLTLYVVSLIFFTNSRGGIVSLLGGTVLWFIGLGAAHRAKPLLISFAAIFLGGILLLLSSSGVVSNRLIKLSGSVKERIVSPTSETASATTAPLDGRVPIFQDTLRLLRDYPFTGIGLGNFRYVFPMYRAHSAWEAPVRHPESDWLMLAAEAGIPAVLATLTGIGLLIHQVWPLRNHPYWPLRWAILCAVFSAGLHGLVDVPAHRIPLGWWLLVLAGLGFQADPRESRPPSRIQHAAFILAGLSAIALSVFLFRAQWFGGPVAPPLAAYEAQVEIIGLRYDGKKEEALDAARAAISKFPLADFLYFQRGLTLLRLGRDGEADDAFREQRLIDPISTDLAVDQGSLWLESDPERTGALWIDALQRRARIDRSESGKLYGSLGLFQKMLADSADNPAVQTRLRDAAQISPEFTLAWLDQAAPSLVAAEFPKLGADAAFTKALADGERERFLKAWYRRGDREQLSTWLATQPDWRKIARPLTLRRLADAGNFSEAVQTAAHEFGFKLDLPEPGAGTRDAPAIAPEKPNAAFAHYWSIGNVVTARRMLDDARADTSAIDPEIWRLSAAVSVRDGRWDAAWGHIERYLVATKQAVFP